MGPLSRDDLPANLGFADVSAEENVADIMRPGALRGAARGRNLDSVAYTLFLRIYPVIAVVVLLTQRGDRLGELRRPVPALHRRPR